MTVAVGVQSRTHHMEASINFIVVITDCRLDSDDGKQTHGIFK